MRFFVFFHIQEKSVVQHGRISLLYRDILVSIRTGGNKICRIYYYLTARDMEEDALAGYESGAEDYVTKPFSMKILLRKIEVILKRTASVNRLIFADEYLYIDLDNARVTVKGQECPVTPTECRLLRQFLMNRGQLLTYDLLLERLWDSGGQFVDKHTLAVNVNRLRGKIEDKNHRYISNVYGMGYQWIG